MTLVLALLFYINTRQFCYPFSLPLLVCGQLTILALVSPYSEKPKVRYVSDFNIGSST